MRVEPDWALAPDWAQWFAIDSNGDMYWYDDEPYTTEDVITGGSCAAYGWIVNGEEVVAAGTIVVYGEKTKEDYPVWRESLRRRPQ